jgi:opacity protein-like surface antigen
MLTAAAATASPEQPASIPAPAPAPAPEPKPDNGLRVTITPRAEHTFEADLDNADASASVTRAGAEFFFLYPLNPRVQLTLSVDGDYSWYSFDGNDPAVFAGRSFDDLLDDAVKLDILPGLRYGLDEKWTLIGGAIVEFAGAPDVDVGDAATFGGFGGARYAFTDRFALTLGAGVKSRLEDNVQVLPFIGLEWKISERFRLASKGPGINLAAAVSDTVAVTAGVAYDSRDYRLEDDNAFFPEGVARDTRVPIRVGVEWAPSKQFSIEAYTGAVVWQEYEFLDRDGQEQIEDNTDIAPFIGVNCSIKF